jgi:hypothetical protein
VLGRGGGGTVGGATAADGAPGRPLPPVGTVSHVA